MSPRSRSNKSFADRPDRVTVHLRGPDTHFGWMDPRDGKEKSLKAKNNRKLAYQRARKLNAVIDAQLEESFNVNISEGPTFESFVPA